MANFIIFMLLVGGPLIVFIYVRITVKRNAEIRRDQETQRQTAAEAQKREWDREWLELWTLNLQQMKQAVNFVKWQQVT